MRMSGWRAVLCLALAGLLMDGCGGGISSNSNPPPQKTTPQVTVTPGAQSISADQSLTVTVTVNGGNGTPTGTVTISSGSYSSAAATLSGGSASITIPANTLTVGTANLTATYTPDAASASSYTSATGLSPVMVMGIVPAVSVSPGSSSIAATQALTVTVTVSGSGGSATPTGSVTLSSVSYTSAAATLTNGSAQITIPAGNLAVGSDTLTAKYTPDTAGATIYASATGTNSVTVSLSTPAVTVTPASNSISTTQTLTVTVTVGGAGPTPTGSVTLTSGSYASQATALSAGSASIAIAAGALATGTDTLAAAYTPDANSAAMYASAMGTGAVTVTGGAKYTLTIDSAAPASGISIVANPADANSKSNGSTPFTLSYSAGTQVTLTAGQLDNGYQFQSWTGCTSTSSTNCTVTMNGNTTVTATYNQTGISSITISPNTATIGTQQLFTATVNGTGSFSNAVTWTLSCPACGSLSGGDFASTTQTTALYNTPYPAPASVTIKATSQQNTSISGSVTVMLNSPATAAGPALSVDAGNETHAISPYIYGMNAYSIGASVAKLVNLPVDRWGGDATSRYNYVLDVTSSASDWYFENHTQATGQENTSGFNQQVESDAAVGAKTLGTVPVLGWVAINGTVCSFPSSTYPSQVGFDPYNAGCGDGLYPQGVNGCTSSSGCNITGNNPLLTSEQVGPSWAGSWVAYLVSKFGTAANGGVAMYDLDNEPAWWDAVHRDVHPSPSTYDEVTNNGIATAEAIKNADPTAAVNGPVVDYWWNYFYSKKDIENGWSSGGPCYQPWSAPVDRNAHGGVPFIEYYLQQFKSASNTYGARLLDYLDLHTYFAGTYNGSGVGLTTAGDTQEQEVRLNSTRVFWDPTYTDPNYPQPNYTTDSNYTTSCNVPLQAPQLIPMAQKWVANDYPGTKIAFTEYNWGGQENINGAVAQADILGIFGAYGLDLATLWGPPDPTTQLPGLIAFEMYRNYDGKNSMFGDTALASTSANQGLLSVYGAVRASDGSLTIMAINKTYGPLTSTLSLKNFVAASGANAQVYQYSAANLNAIVTPAAVPVTPPSGSGTTSTIQYTFPGQSITLFVVPN